MIVFRSVCMWGYLALSMPVLWLGAVAILVLTLPFDHRRIVLHRYTCLWAAHYLWVSPFWKVTVEGRQLIAPGTAYVMVANHESMGDILVLFELHRHFKWVSKHTIFKVPFMGWNMWMNDYVQLRRGESGSIDTMMASCRKHLGRGSSVMMFPEGTRSRDGRIKGFKHGAFTLACEAGVAVLPVVLNGTRTALPKEGFLFRDNSDMTVRVLPPVHPTSVGGDRHALERAVRQRMGQELAAMRGVELDRAMVPLDAPDRRSIAV